MNERIEYQIWLKIWLNTSRVGNEPSTRSRLGARYRTSRAPSVISILVASRAEYEYHEIWPSRAEQNQYSARFGSVRLVTSIEILLGARCSTSRAEYEQYSARLVYTRSFCLLRHVIKLMRCNTQFIPILMQLIEFVRYKILQNKTLN